MTTNVLLFYSCDDIQSLLGISRSKAYKLIRTLNQELEKKNYIVIPGKVPKKYFAERYYGGVEEV